MKEQPRSLSLRRESSNFESGSIARSSGDFKKIFGWKRPLEPDREISVHGSDQVCPMENLPSQISVILSHLPEIRKQQEQVGV